MYVFKVCLINFIISIPSATSGENSNTVVRVSIVNIDNRTSNDLEYFVESLVSFT